MGGDARAVAGEGDPVPGRRGPPSARTSTVEGNVVPGPFSTRRPRAAVGGPLARSTPVHVGRGIGAADGVDGQARARAGLAD